MPEFNNSAGRILAVLESLAAVNKTDSATLAQCLGSENDWNSILVAVTELRNEYKVLVDAIEQFKDNRQKYKLYKKNLPDVEKSINSLSLNLGGKNFNASVVGTGVVALRFIAADLPPEETASDDELTQLRKTIIDLQSQVENCEGLTRTVRTWLLDLLRLMRDGLDRYAIRGGRGLRRQFHTLLGDLMDNYEIVKQVEKSQSGLWQSFCRAVDFMIKLAVFGEKYRPAIEMVKKALPFWSNEPPDVTDES